MTITLRPAWHIRALDALSQGMNAWLLNGDPNESISGRAHREGWKKTEAVINAVIFWEEDHCAWAYLSDLARAREIIKQHDQRI